MLRCVTVVHPTKRTRRKGGELMKKFVIREAESLKTTEAAFYCGCGC